MHLRLLCLALLAGLAGCSTFEALPLKDQPNGSNGLEHLTVDAASMPFPALVKHRFDPSDGLDEVEVAMLAVANNPDLRVARDDAAVAQAQSFAAGLLPDPQLALTSDLSNTGGPGSVTAYSLGLSYDINALLMHASAKATARSDSRKVDLNLLWQEWQVVSQARLLFVKLVQAKKLMAVLDATQTLFAERLRRTQTALDRGLLTSDAVSINLTALQDVQRQVFELKKQINQNSHELNSLLGLAPDAQVVLQEEVGLADLDEAGILAAEKELSLRRPDLLGLQAGYQAQDQRYRGAILAQFPALNVGLTRARDSAGIYSNAVGITLSLPFLNGNRGNIAIEKATRQKLFDEYQQRLQASRNDIHRILDEQRLNMQQLGRLDRAVAEMIAVLARNDTALQASNIDALVYANARAALLAKQVEQVNLRQAVWEQRIGLQTLVGAGLPMHDTLESHSE